MSACPIVQIKSSHPSQGDFIEINESDFDAAKHERYVAPPPPPPAAIVPPPPPDPRDPLANLSKDWRNGKTAELRAQASAASGGRMPENREQAVQMIEAALLARK
jgi:hypothetical protein